MDIYNLVLKLIKIQILVGELVGYGNSFEQTATVASYALIT